jgi:3-vinyl bacteriochlorophyllide hydratase
MNAVSFRPDQNLSGRHRSYCGAAKRGQQDVGVHAHINRVAAQRIFAGWLDSFASCPWGAHAGLDSFNLDHKLSVYTADQRQRRDSSPWTIVQAVLTPLQFLAFAVSIVLIGRYSLTGAGYEATTVSILAKTFALYAVMITGSVWEKAVFNTWLFADAFFWEDVFSILVLVLQTAYVAALMLGVGSPQQQMMIALAAYAAYAVNAAQILLKLRAARLEATKRPSGMLHGRASLRGSL